MRTKITANTTLGELALLRSKLGVESMTIIPGPYGNGRTVMVRTAIGYFTGTGPTEAEAIDIALSKLEDHIGIDLIKDRGGI